MKKTILFLVCLAMACVLAACSGEKEEVPSEGISEADSVPVPVSADSGFRIGYDLGGEFTDKFTDRPSEAIPGETVELRTVVLHDADIHVFVNGQEIEKTHYDSDYWGYSFIMPNRDVTVTARFYTKDEIWGNHPEP